MKLVFLGDISLNGNYIQKNIENNNPFFVDFSDSDYVVGNIECLAKGDGENLLKNPRLKTRKATLSLLKNINLNIGQLAHNHVYDNLRKGFEDTIDFFVENNIKYLGASQESGLVDKPVILKNNDISVCLLNYVTKDTNPNLPIDADVYLNWFDEKKVITDIKKYKRQCDFVVLLLHWGGKMEGAMLPDFDQVGLAHRLVDAGADLIVGNHSHTVQPCEIYKSKHIYYSLGNFCFSDDFSEKQKCLISMDLIRHRYSRVLFVNLNKENMVVSSCYSYRNKKDEVSLVKRRARIALLLYQKIFKIIFCNKRIWQIYRKCFVLFRPINKILFDCNVSFINVVKTIEAKKILKILTK